jgi:Flp pilus assembly protein TadD
LAALFAGGGWLLFLRARRIQGRSIRYLVFSLAWISGLLAFCSRENACLWPLLFLLYHLAFERRTLAWRRWTLIASCLLLFASYFVLRQLPNGRPVPGPSSGWPPSMRAVLMLRSLGDYGRLMLFPANLHMERTVFNGAAVENEKARQNSIELEYLSIGGLVLFGALLLLAARPGQGQRARVFGAAWFILTYLPISNLVELNATVAEHWLYLPSVGFLIFLAGCARDLPIKWRNASVALAGVAVLALAVRSGFRSGDWQSNEVFARRTIAAGGTSVRAALLLGQVFSGRGDYVEAERLLRKALQICPDYPIARNNLADALLHLGKEKEAEALFAESTKGAHEAMKEYPRTWIAAMNLAHLRYKRGDETGAIGLLERARLDYPETWELISTESELLREKEKVDAAVNLVRPYAERNWWHQRSWIALGRLYAQKNDIEGAAAALRHASWLDLHDTAALNLIALMRVRQNQFDAAWQAQRRAVARQPDEPRQYLLLSDILGKMGREDEARAALAEATRLRSLAVLDKAAN